MIEVRTYYMEEHKVWAGEVIDHPEVNASGLSEDQMMEYLVPAWNAHNPDDQHERSDFHLTQQDTPWWD